MREYHHFHWKCVWLRTFCQRLLPQQLSIRRALNIVKVLTALKTYYWKIPNARVGGPVVG